MKNEEKKIYYVNKHREALFLLLMFVPELLISVLIYNRIVPTLIYKGVDVKAIDLTNINLELSSTVPFLLLMIILIAIAFIIDDEKIQIVEAKAFIKQWLRMLLIPLLSIALSIFFKDTYFIGVALPFIILGIFNIILDIIFIKLFKKELTLENVQKDKYSIKDKIIKKYRLEKEENH
ncbi:MAG: hypothetical protein GXZ08_10135 [Tissierellia bacterium]|nr:hypothetical protein [Tissierellia bacterium]